MLFHIYNWHFLPTMTTKPVDLMRPDMAEHYMRAAGTVGHNTIVP
jgi:hypothetical protein